MFAVSDTDSPFPRHDNTDGEQLTASVVSVIGVVNIALVTMASKRLVSLRDHPNLVPHRQNDDAEPGQSNEKDDPREDL